MRLFAIIFALFIGTSIWAQTEEIVIKTELHCDHCAKCGDCKPKIENAFLYSKGVKSAVLNVEEETITVTYNAKKTDPETLRNALANAGFQADDVPADPEAHSKLDACCRKKN